MNDPSNECIEEFNGKIEKRSMEKFFDVRLISFFFLFRAIRAREENEGRIETRIKFSENYYLIV